MTTKAQRAERAEAIERLRDWCHPGDTIYTVLRHVSASGMMRVIQVVSIDNDPKRGPYVSHLGYNVARAIDATYDRNREGIRVSGCGMDMGFWIVYELSAALWPDGFECIGESCPSNDHSNGAPYKPTHHRDGGYALSQRWI